MRFGVREICDVVFKAKTAQKIGNKIFYANEPVIYFDTLKTSSMEGAATTVYAQGGRGNARLVAWEGERTVTFTMEDALISPEGFMILTGAGLIEATENKPIYQHMTETVDIINDCEYRDGELFIPLSHKPYLPEEGNENYAYVMFKKNGEIVSEPFIPNHEDVTLDEDPESKFFNKYLIRVAEHETYQRTDEAITQYTPVDIQDGGDFEEANKGLKFDSVLVDYYQEQVGSNAQQIEITADKFSGNYYVEASTLFRTQEGIDMPAEFVIPNCKIQSNFTFTMASSGDPSTFTFTLDAFPDYTRFDHSKKVFAAIQIITDAERPSLFRTQTKHEAAHEELDMFK